MEKIKSDTQKMERERDGEKNNHDAQNWMEKFEITFFVYEHKNWKESMESPRLLFGKQLNQYAEVKYS